MATRKTDKQRIKAAVAVAVQYGGIDGDHHKTWVIDQMLRELLGETYDEFREDVLEEGGKYEWSEGIAP